MEQIIVNIAADGTVTVKAEGVRGQGCAALTRAIEQAIGTTTADQKTAEYFQQEKAGAKQANRAGQG